MRKKMNLIIQLLMIGLLITTINSCKKEDVIIKKDVDITWSNPIDIALGTPLSVTQLNATTIVPGTFVFTPGSGTILSLGSTQDLKVDYTPADATSYNIASKTVKINVRQGVSSVVFNPNLTYGIMTDQDGNAYKTIKIGTQTWMAENLRVTKYRNGDPIPNVTDSATWITLTTGAYCNYENTTNMDKICTSGRLYNWFTVADNRNIALTGWHVPTDAEWITLITFLGDKFVAGGKMKEIGTTHWLSPNTGATNESGFSASPAGDRGDNGRFVNLGEGVSYWSITQSSASNAWSCYIGFFSEYCFSGSPPNATGFAVRLLKD